MPSRLKRWLRTFHTIKHLQPRQAWYFFLRRVVGPNTVKPSQRDLTYRTILTRQISVHPALALSHSHADFHDYSFTFLNCTVDFPLDAMNWSPSQTQRLWRYNLHYFDFLRDPERSQSQKMALIDHWIAHNPQGSEPAWEPYTASLRIVNWCLFFWSLPPEKISEQWIQSLYLQVQWLERNLELHILANHYFENIKAMLFAALFFDTKKSTHWLKYFQSELVIQLSEQTLSDGGHYERSPQYHCILLEDYLDLYALLSQNAKPIKPESLTLLSKTINTGLKFLALIATPDDDIPLFNDSASGSSSRPSVIFGRARQLGFETSLPPTTLINLPDSGLFGWKSGGDYFLIDCGDIGPNYQPGHTHCDFLSFVLMVNHRWIVVDSGVCEYEPGKMRSYVRSTRAHNTVIIDDTEQSEVWGEFRVGRRASRIDASISHSGNEIIFDGAFSGFPELAAKIVHRRSAVLTLNQDGHVKELTIKDAIDGRSQSQHNIQSLLHLHPSFTCVIQDESIEIYCDGKASALIEGMSLSIDSESWYCPQFGVMLPNQKLQASSTTFLPTELTYRLKISS